MDWYYAENGEQRGPVSDIALEDLVRQSVVRAETLVWNATMSDWRPYRDVRSLAFPDESSAFSPTVYPVREERTEPLAIAGFVLAIVSMFTCFLVAIAALICGHMALRRINASGGALAGRAFALAGLVIAYAMLGITALVTLFFIVGMATS